MKLALKKWGNSLAVRIPKEFSENLMFLEDSSISAHIEGKKLILELDDKETQLDKILAGIQKQKEIDWGEARGKEFW